MNLTTYMREVCKIGQQGECCRYLIGGPNGFECAKLNPGLAVAIDSRVEQMNAQGDNCEGKANLEEAEG